MKGELTRSPVSGRGCLKTRGLIIVCLLWDGKGRPVLPLYFRPHGCLCLGLEMEVGRGRESESRTERERERERLDDL